MHLPRRRSSCAASMVKVPWLCPSRGAQSLADAIAGAAPRSRGPPTLVPRAAFGLAMRGQHSPRALESRRDTAAVPYCLPYAKQKSPIPLPLATVHRPADAKAFLREWCLENIDNPYPTEAEKLDTCIQTSLTLTQINNWSVTAARTH